MFDFGAIPVKRKKRRSVTIEREMTQELELANMIGFEGKVQGALHYHPNGRHLVYTLGSAIVIRQLKDGRTHFLEGHKGPVSCVAISESGRYVASGNSTHMGFKADVIIWDFETKKIVHRMTQHKMSVASVNFSHDEQKLVSMGGQDDLNVTVWSVKEGKRLCTTMAPRAGNSIKFFNTRNDMIVAGGRQMLRVWEIDYVQRKMTEVDCKLGQLQRIITSLLMDEVDEYLYCGTTTGDVLCVKMRGPKNFKFSGPRRMIDKGVSSLSLAPDGNIVAGGGDGSLFILNRETLLKMKSTKLMGAVSSISEAGTSFYIGTAQSVIYLVDYNDTLESTMVMTCHSHRINDVCYPAGTSEILATCSINDIRLWNAYKAKELVRIAVPNLECNCITFNKTGTAIISGWSDGKIRAFGPQSGKLLFVINDAHKSFEAKKNVGALVGVTALAVSDDNQMIVSGGSDGHVHLWNIGGSTQNLISIMKEHKSTVTSIVIRSDNSECITASDDGSCIVWNLEKFVRSNIMYAQTYFKEVAYLDDESQMLTTGSDKRITYWDAFDCNAIRELEGSETGEIRSLDISPDGQMFVSGGQDLQVKLWHYDQGEIVAIGKGHSSGITRVRFSPDRRFICSVGEEGGIFIWKNSA